MTTQTPDAGPRVDGERIAGFADEIDAALMACDFPLLVWRLPSGVVQLGNRPAVELFGRAPDRLVGSAAQDLMGPGDAVAQTIAMVGSGLLDNVHARRWLRSRSGRIRQVQVWTRAVEVDGSRAAVSLVVPLGDLGRLGRDPLMPWRDLLPVAVGVADAQLRVATVSSDIRNILGLDPGDLVGRSLHDVVSLDNVLIGGEGGADTSVSHWQATAARGDGTRIDVCVLVAAVPAPQSSGVAFAIIAAPAPVAGRPHSRVRELERRMRVIGAEVRAAGVLEEVAAVVSVADHPQLGRLTSRQWDILSRLVHGDRVPTIAAELYVSASTVRNHLARIFHHFGVHSQSELLAELRSHHP